MRASEEKAIEAKAYVCWAASQPASMLCVCMCDGREGVCWLTAALAYTTQSRYASRMQSGRKTRLLRDTTGEEEKANGHARKLLLLSEAMNDCLGRW